MLRQLNASEADAQLYARLANTVVYSQPTLRADAADAAAQPARPVGAVGLRDLRRPADRAAADQRCRQHRPRAADGAGARLLAAQGPGRRPGHLERGPRRLPPAAAGADPRPDREQPRGARGRPARRHLRAPRRADRATRIACCCRPWRAAIVSDRLGTLAQQVAVEAGGAAPAAAARAVRASPSPPWRAPPPADTERADALQRHRRLHARRPRVRDRHRRQSIGRRRRGST